MKLTLPEPTSGARTASSARSHAQQLAAKAVRVPVSWIKLPGRAFTLVELLVVIGTLAVLAAFMLPVLAGTKPSYRAVQCMENQRRLMLAWRMYANDNNDILPPNEYPYSASFVTYANKDQMRNWAVGTMVSPFDAISTNILLAPQSLLSAYVKSPATYKCPADTVMVQGRVRSRSYSMSNAVGTRWWSTTAGGGGGAWLVGARVGGAWLSGSFQDPDPNYRTFGRLSEMISPGPANTWVIIDENPQTMNDALMAVVMPTNTTIIDVPAGSHDRAAGVAFADGHTEIHRWLDVRTCGPSSIGLASPNNPDMLWLAAHTTVPR